MVEIDLEYEGDLHCRLRHGPSGAVIVTDAPVDNHGKGEAFSPTDLLAASLGACVMTTMAIFARRKEVDLKGGRAKVTKEMIVEPQRRVARLTVVVDLPASVPAHLRPALECSAHTCPVERSLRPEVEVVLTIRYTL
jgi:putative redox protein